MKTTPAPIIKIDEIFPELAELKGTTIRLHPRRDKNLELTDSKIAGSFAWPAAQDWPRCQLHNDYLVGVLQLKKSDFSEFKFPDDKDLFQLWWCPQDHDEYSYAPLPASFWWNMTELTDLKGKNPLPNFYERHYIPEQCRLNPETVIEYPSIYELPNKLVKKINKCAEIKAAIKSIKFDGDPAYFYQNLLSTADGTKLGGYVEWVQEPEVPVCQCQHPMEHLLTIASAEFDGGSYHRWCPIEDQANIWQLSHSERERIQAAPDITVGDMGYYYVFICYHCPDWPITAFSQSS